MTITAAKTGRRRVVTAVAAALLVAGAQVVTAHAGLAAATTTIKVDPARPFGALPPDFVGLSYEMRELSTRCTTGTCVGGFDAQRGNLATLMRNLGRSNVRIAGNQLDRDTLWVPAGQQPPDPLPEWVKDIVTAADIRRLDGLLRATGWKAEVGINLAHFDAASAADQATVLRTVLGERLAGAACGNEPNHYVGNGFRTAPYGFAEHRRDWQRCAAVSGGVRLASPDLSSPTTTATWFRQFAEAERARLAMLTVHNYTGAKTVSQLLSPQIRTRQLADVSPQLAAARSVGVPIRLDETNSAVGGGIAGVSDVYASALWAMDYNLVMAQAGFNGLNFHGGFGVCGAPLFNGKFQHYTPLCAANDQDLRAKVYKAMPVYYGLYMATRMRSGPFLPVTVSSDRNVTAYAVRGGDGRVRIALIEKDDTSAAAVPISLSVAGAGSCVSVLRLTGRSLSSPAGVTVQGATVDVRGNLILGPADHIQVDNDTVNLNLASGSAAVITLDNCA
jgi:hypothetical protein